MSTGSFSSALSNDWAPLPIESGFDVDSALPLTEDGEDQLFRAAVNTRIAGDLVDYSTHYSLTQGDILHNMQNGGQNLRRAPTGLGAQAAEQRLQLNLPVSRVAPVKLGFSNRQQSLLTVDGEQYEDFSRTSLRWAPGALNMNMHWSPPREKVLAGRPLDCNLHGNVELPVESLGLDSDASLNLHQRQCRILAPWRGLTAADELSMDNWGVAWRWGRGDQRNAVRMQHVALQSADGFLPDRQSAHEFGLFHRHTLGNWRAEADITAQQLDRTARSLQQADSQWSADFGLRRQLDSMSITARWLYNRDPLWFASGARPLDKERFFLRFDLNSWLAALLPEMDANMAASLHWSRNAAGQGDRRLNWHVSMIW